MSPRWRDNVQHVSIEDFQTFLKTWRKLGRTSHTATANRMSSAFSRAF